MAREKNFLLGHGERLAHQVKVPKRGGDKNPPYDLPAAKTRIGKRLDLVTATIANLPDDACPRGEAVAVLTLHPRYLAKSDFPHALLTSVGLRPIGSRSRAIVPEQWGIKEHADESITDEIFVAGSRSAFERWSDGLKNWTAKSQGAADLTHIEDVRPFEEDAKVQVHSIPQEPEVMLEHRTV